MNNLVKTTDIFAFENTAGLNDVAKRFRIGELGALWEIEGAGILKQKGKQITKFSEDFTTPLVKEGKWSGDVSTLNQGNKILHEMKGTDWAPEVQNEQITKIIKQNKFMKDIKSSGQINDYIFEFRVEPPINIKTQLKDIPWEVLQ